MSDKDRFSTIKSYALVALIFAVLATAVWAVVFVLGVLSIVFAAFGGSSVVTDLFSLIWVAIYAVLVAVPLTITLRSHEMYTAAVRQDAKTLKRLSSLTWAILGIVFGSVIPGIMLLLARGEIDALGSR